MKNYDTTTSGFEKMESKRTGFKKDKQVGRKTSTNRMRYDNEDYEEYFNTRYGNKLYKS